MSEIQIETATVSMPHASYPSTVAGAGGRLPHRPPRTFIPIGAVLCMASSRDLSPLAPATAIAWSA